MRDDKGRFQTGNKASPGRPVGSRAKLSEAFLAALCADFMEHGAAVVEKVRQEKPEAYLKLIASILPKQLEVSGGLFDEISDDDLAALVKAAGEAIQLIEETSEPEDAFVH